MHFLDSKHFTVYGRILPNCLLYYAHDIGYYIFDLTIMADLAVLDLEFKTLHPCFSTLLKIRLTNYDIDRFTHSDPEDDWAWLLDRARRLSKLELLL